MKKEVRKFAFGFQWAQQREERWAFGALSAEKMRGAFDG